MYIMVIRKFLLLSLLSSPIVLCMDMPKEQSSLKVTTDVAERQALKMFVRELQAIEEEFDEEIGFDEGRTGSENQSPFVSQSGSGYANQSSQSMANFGSIEKFFEVTHAKVYQKIMNALNKMDKQSVVPLFLFVEKMQGYMDIFKSCKTEQDMRDLLQTMEKDQAELSKLSSACAPVLIKMGQIYLKVLVKNFVMLIPADIRSMVLGLLSMGAQQLNVDSQSFVKLISSGSISGMVGSFPQVPAQAKHAVLFLEGCAKNLQLAPQQEQLLLGYYEQKFPLNDARFTNKTFKDLTRHAFMGDLETIIYFGERFDDLIASVDEKGENLLTYAISGYLNGKENTWDIFAYLFNLCNKDLKVTKSVMDILKAPLKEGGDIQKEREKDTRKKQILQVLNGLDHCPMNPPQESQNCIIS